MAKKKIARTPKRTRQSAARPTAAKDDFSPAGLAARIEAESQTARLVLSRLLAAVIPNTSLDRNAGHAVYIPDELARIAAALRSIEAAAAFVRCSGVAS